MKNKLVFLIVFNFFTSSHISAMGKDVNKEFSILPLQSGQFTDDQERTEFKKLFMNKCDEEQFQTADVLSRINEATKQRVDENGLANLLYDIYSFDKDYRDLGRQNFIAFIINDVETLISLVSKLLINNKKKLKIAARDANISGNCVLS